MTNMLKTLLPFKRAETVRKDIQEMNLANMALRVRVDEIIRKTDGKQAA